MNFFGFIIEVHHKVIINTTMKYCGIDYTKLMEIFQEQFIIVLDKNG